MRQINNDNTSFSQQFVLVRLSQSAHAHAVFTVSEQQNTQTCVCACHRMLSFCAKLRKLRRNLTVIKKYRKSSESSPHHTTFKKMKLAVLLAASVAPAAAITCNYGNIAYPSDCSANKVWVHDCSSDENACSSKNSTDADGCGVLRLRCTTRSECERLADTPAYDYCCYTDRCNTVPSSFANGASHVVGSSFAVVLSVASYVL